jgi:hypothetical protein
VALADALGTADPAADVFGHHDLLPGNFIDDGKRLAHRLGGFAPDVRPRQPAANGSFSPPMTGCCLKPISGNR